MTAPPETARMGEDVDGVRTDVDGPVLTVTLTSPATRNAQTPATWRRLAALPYLLTPEIRTVVLRADGPSFSAGLDRRMLSPQGVPGEPSLLEVASWDPSRVDAFIDRAQDAFAWWHDVPQVTICLVNGHAIGAGFQLALACDLMIVADDALLAMRETSLGLVPDLLGTARLVESVGYARALEICASGRFVTASEAVGLGIAIRQVPDGQWSSALDDLLKALHSAPDGAVGELKWLLRGAGPAADQRAREREAQLRRLAALAPSLRAGGLR